MKVTSAPAQFECLLSRQHIIWSSSLIAKQHNFPPKQQCELWCQIERLGTNQLPQVYKTGLNSQSTLSCLPVDFAQVFQREAAKATANCAVKNKLISAARAGAGPTPALPPPHPAFGKHKPSPFLLLLSMSMEWPGLFYPFWAADHRQLMLPGNSWLSPVFSPRISISLLTTSWKPLQSLLLSLSLLKPS